MKNKKKKFLVLGLIWATAQLYCDRKKKLYCDIVALGV